MEKMWDLNNENKWNITFNKVGCWWNNTTEIDIVALDSTGNDIIFGKCKYTKKKLDINIFYNLLEKTKEVIWKNNNRREYYILFNINGFTNEMLNLANSSNDILLR